VEGGTLGDSLRSGLGEAARSAVESPDQTAQRDQLRLQQQQWDAQQRAQIGAQAGGTIYQDDRGQRYTLDAQGGRVYMQQPGSNQFQGQSQPQAVVQGNAAGQWQPNRQGPTLGVAIEGAEQGVRVLDVRPGSAAEKAGIQRGDVITAVNGQNISSPQALVQSIGSANGQIDLAIVRNGQPTQMTAMLTASQDMQRVAKPAIEGESQGAGLSEDFAQLQSQMAELQQELQSLRQEVMDLKTSKGTQTETLNNTPPTALDEEPADPFSESPAPAEEDVDDLFKNDNDAPASDDAAPLK
ncbi:MAG: PDZ domain-containing protein, partial [Planctomycetaceae bacterium]